MLKALRLLALAAGLLLLLMQPAAAQTLDPTFTPPTGLYTLGSVYSMAAQQADGQRVVAGNFTRVNNVVVGSLARLNAAGALDAAFAQNVGRARNIDCVQALPNGQYLVGSVSYNNLVTAGGLTRPALLRLNANGTADASFDAGTGPAGPGYVVVNTFVGQPDGKVLVGGSFTSFNGQRVSGLVRLNADGSPDAAFNANLGTGFNYDVSTLALQPDGKLLVGGRFDVFNGQPTQAVVRLTADGTRDATFSSDLRTISSVDILVLQPDGKLLVCGFLDTANGFAWVVRLTATGTLDTSFTLPKSLVSYSSHFPGSYVALQPDGKILLSVDQKGGTAHVVRLNTDGTPDNSFTLVDGPPYVPYTIALQRDGSLWVANYFTAADGREIALSRYSSTGAADASFAPKIQTAGTVTAVVRQADGQLVVGGDFTEYGGVAVRRLVRVSATGTLDAAFVAATAPLPAQVTALAVQPNGKLLVGSSSGLRRLLPTGGPDASYGTFAATATVRALAMLPDGRAVIGIYLGLGSGSATDSYLMRLTADGDRDPSFDAPSTNTFDFIASTLALQPDGKLLVSGDYLAPASNSYVQQLVRYESTGAVDASFAVAASFLSTSARINALAVQPDGKVLAGGYFDTVNGAARANVARFTATGLLDASFVPPAARPGVATALTLQPNGRLLVGSAGDAGILAATPLVRLLDTGAPDLSFGPSGAPDNTVYALLVQPDGAIVAGGSFETIGGAASPGLARLTAPNVLAVAAPAAVAARTEVWPVPAHSVLHVAPDASAHPHTVDLLDTVGRVVRTQAIGGGATVTLPVEGLPAGLYLLRVQYAAGPVTRAVVVR